MTCDPTLAGRRIAVIYDCLFPYTIGGGERWYRRLAEGLRAAGAEVTYLTRQQWDEDPDLPGIRVVAVSGRSELYDSQGRRRLLPTIRFGAGLFWWLLRHRRDFDAVQVANFPFWSVLAVRAALAGTGTIVVVDWFEIWTREFWRSYAGAIMGTVGYEVQRICLLVSPKVVLLTESAAKRVIPRDRSEPPIAIAGLLPDDVATTNGDHPLEPAPTPYVLFAGRHIHDKGVDLLPKAFAEAHDIDPELRFVIAGDGPLRARITDECRQRGLHDVVDIPGFVSDDELERLIAGATCVVVPSRREGYGFMPVDAMGKGTPAITTAFDENLAVDNIDEGRNGFIVSPPTSEGIAKAIVAVADAGPDLRKTTIEWYREHAPTKTVSRSVSQMVSKHAEWGMGASTPNQ